MVKRPNRKAAKFPSLNLWFGLGLALILAVSFVAFYFWPNEDAIGGEFVRHDKKHGDSVTEQTPDPEYPPRKVRQAWYKTNGKAETMVTRPLDLPIDSSYVMLTGEYDQWLLGTPVEIAIPQTGKRYRSIVDRIAPDEFGNVSIHAKPDEHEEEFLHLIVTFNSEQTLAYVTTTVGNYELNGSGRGGWVSSTSSMQKKRDFSLKDLMETQRDRHATTKYVPPRED